MGQYNPHAPLMVGNEYAPVLQSNYRPDLFVERGYSFRHDDSAILNGWVSMFVDKLPAWAVPGHAYLWTLYRRGQEVSTGPMKTLDLPFITMRASLNTLDQDGAAPGTNDIEYQTDGNYIRFRTGGTGESYIRLAVDSAAATPFFAVTGKRIVDVSILYTASAEPGNDDPVPMEINHYNFCTSQRVSYGNAVVALRESLITSLQRSRWGEIGTWNTPDNALTQDTSRYPWNASLLQNFGGIASNWGVEFRTVSAAQDVPREIRLHHARMRITYCEENRVAVAGMVAGSDYINADITTGEPFSGYLPGRNTPNSFGIGMIDPQSLQFDCTAGTSSWGNGLTGVRDLTLTLKRADYGPYNNQGPLPEVRALRTVDVFPSHPGVVINNTVEPGEFNTIASTDLIPQIILHTEPVGAEPDNQAPAVPFIHPYGVQEPLAVFGGQPVVQEILEMSNGTDVPYPQLRFWARHLDATAPLKISIETTEQGGPFVVAYLSTTDFETFPEIADGWRQITIPVDVSLLIDDDGGTLTPAAPRWESDTSELRAWQILAERVRRPNWDSSWTMPINPLIASTTGRATYGNETVEGGEEGDFPTTADIDVSVVWGQALPTITGLAVELAVQPLAAVDSDCPIPPACIADGLYFLSVTWDPEDTGYEFVGLGYYELQRQDDTMGDDEWEVVARAIHPLVSQFDDYEARTGIETRYRIRYVHQNGMFGAWSAEVGMEVPAPGVTGVAADKGVLIFSSNVDPTKNLAYVQVWQGAANEDFEFVEASTRELQRMYGRDYQVAFRPLERGGVQFTRSLLINAARIPVETLYEGFTSLRDMAWADLPYVCVRSDRGDRWLSNVNSASGSIRNRRKLYVAEVEITEVTAEPYAPEPTYCEGMTARGSLPSTVYEPRFATTPASTALSSDDLSLRAQIRPDQLEQLFPIMARFNPLSSGWVFYYDDGILRFTLQATFPASFFSAPLPFDPGDLYWVRFDYNMNGGTGGTASSGQFYTSVDGVVWTPLATTTVSSALTSAKIADGQPLTVGAVADGTSDWIVSENVGGAGGWNGVILKAELRDFDPGGTTGMDLDGVAGSYADTPDTASLDIPGDIDLRIHVRPDVWPPVLDSTMIGKYDDTVNQRAYRFDALATGGLRLTWSTTGVNSFSAVSTSTLTIPSGTTRALRVTMDVDNGAAGRTHNFYYGPTISGPWTQLGTSVVTAGVTSIFNSTADLEVGARDNGTRNPFAGIVYTAQVYNGIAGVLVANPDFAAQPPGTTVFVDSTGKTWTLHGGAVIAADPAIDTILANPDFSAQDGDTVEFLDAEGNVWNVAEGICTVDRRL